MTVSVSFPVEAHVRKYLLRRYGSAHIVSKTTLLGTQVLESLTKEYDMPEAKTAPVYKYTVLVPEFYYNTYGHNITKSTLQHLAIQSKHLFEEAMLEHLEIEVLKGKKVMTTLRVWLRTFNITEDDAKLESLYKTWQRHIKKKKVDEVPSKPMNRNRRQRKKK